jgi:hypothetical protein
MSEDSSTANSSSSLLSGRLPLIILIVVIVISLLAVCGLGYALFQSQNEEAPQAESGEPTPFPQSGGGASPGSSGGEALIFGISDNSTVSVTLDAPVSLTISGRNLVVQPVSINPDGTWSPPISAENGVGWVHGSIVNYIMGLNPSDENKTMLESLTPGERMVVTTQSGAEMYFEFESSRLVAVNDPQSFSQLMPGLTLALMEEGDDQRLIANGRYLLSESTQTGGSSSGSTVSVGETAQLSDIQVTVTGVSYLPNDPNSPPGFAFFVVDFQVYNTGTTAADISKLQLTLIDEIGNQYALNPVASRLGANAPLTGGFLNAGQALPITVGYQVPEGLVSSSLTLTVSRSDSGEQVQVNIPFSGGNVVQNTSITLQSVEVAADLASMHLIGQIVNNGEQPVVTTQEDVWLRTPDGSSYLMLSTNPAFPWTVPPGQTLQYGVTFQTPAGAESAVFNVLNQSFQLTNLSS